MRAAGPLSLFALACAAGACGGGRATGTGGTGGTGPITCGPGTVLVGDECVLPDGGANGGSGGGGGAPCNCSPPLPSGGWSGPGFTWMGAWSDRPSCPPDLLFPGGYSLVTVLDNASCPTCTCGPSTGTCALPATMTANAATCAQTGPSTPHTPFDPASGWSGACDTNDSIPSGKLCSGVDCVESLTIAEVTLNEAGCTPSPANPMLIGATPGNVIMQCTSPNPVACGDVPTQICLPPAPPGFKLCIYNLTPTDCSNTAPFTEQFMSYQDLEDHQGCTPCTCSPPSGSTCSSTVSVYTDGACSSLAYSTTVDTSGPTCHDLPPGTPLGSKSATPPAYVPGSCTPGGGTVDGPAPTLSQPSTWCCVP